MFDKKNLLIQSNILWDKSRAEYDEIYNDEDEYKDIMDYRQLHSKVVADLALSFYDNYFKDICGTSDEKLKSSLYFGCLVHDTKKLTQNHNLVGADFLKSSADLIDTSFFDLSLSYVLVRYHTASKKRNTAEYFKEISDLSAEIKILLLFTRLSDKLSKLVVKSSYKEIMPADVDKIISKTVNRSPELINAYSATNPMINSIALSFKNKYCINFKNGLSN